MYFVSIQVVLPYSSTNTASISKKSCFILSENEDFHMIDNMPIEDEAFA